MKRAVEAAENEKWADCVSALLEAWRPLRQPELAELIERVSARTTAPGVAASMPAILGRIERATDHDVPVLIAAIQRQLRTYPMAAKVLLELATRRAPDSRIATALAALFLKSPYRGEEGRFDTKVLDALDAIDDPRYRTLISEAGPYAASRRSRLHRKRPQIDHLIEVAAAVEKRRPPPPLDAGNLAAIAAIDAALVIPTRAASRGRTTLLDAIYADPASTEARLIYADVLQEAGDPRGEFITLQCSRGADDPPSRRERELLKLYERPWLGELDPELRKAGVVYRRGFLSDAVLATRPKQPSRIWQTVEALDLGDSWQLEAWLPTLRALRRVTRLSAADLVALAAPVAWTSIGLRDASEVSYSELIAREAMFPALRELDLSERALNRAVMSRLATSPLGARLKNVRVRTDLSIVAEKLGFPIELVPEYNLNPQISVRLANKTATFIHRSAKTLRYASAVAARLPAGFSAHLVHPKPNAKELAAFVELLREKRIPLTISETLPVSTDRPGS